MSFRVSWQADEDVVMGDLHHSPASPWRTSSPVWKAGRQLSGWLFPGQSHGLPMRLPSPTLSCYMQGLTVSDDMEIDSENPNKPSTPFKAPFHINDLPVELLGEIFMHYTHSFTYTDTDVSPRFGNVAVSRSTSTNPILLGHVCGYWRALSLSTPGLWSTISVTLPTSRDVAILQTWLDRSGDCPLHLTIVQGSLKRGGECVIPLVLRLALAHRSRWRSISFVLRSNAQTSFSQLDSVPLHDLRHAEIDFLNWSSSKTKEVCEYLYSSVSLKGLSFGTSWTDLTVLATAPWGKLHSVHLNHLHSSQLFPILSSIPNARRFSVAFIEGSLKDQSGGLLHLKSLRTLTLGMLQDSADVLDRLILPNLVSLNLGLGFGSIGCSRRGLYSLVELLRRSRCQLRALEYTCAQTGCQEEALAQIIREPVMSSLTELSIKSKVADIVLSTLNEGVLPHLQYLELGRCYSTDGLFASLVLSRSQTLRRVKAGFYGISRTLDLTLDVPHIDLDITDFYS